MKRALVTLFLFSGCLDFPGALARCEDAGLCSSGGGGGAATGGGVATGGGGGGGGGGGTATGGGVATGGGSGGGGGGGSTGGGGGGATGGGGGVIQGALLLEAPGGTSFGGVLPGDAGVRSYGLRNVGTVDVTSVSVAVDPGDFTVEPANPCSTVGVDASCAFQVVFRPSTTGLITTALTAQGAPGATATPLTLSGNGLSPTPSFSLSAATAFGDLVTSSTAVQTLTFTNTGTPTLSGISVTVSALPFSLLNDNCTGNSFAAGGQCTFDVRFAPTAPGQSMAFARVNVSQPTVLPTQSTPLLGDAHAEFALTVTISPQDAGRVVSEDAGIDCPTRCSQQVRAGASPQLTAIDLGLFGFTGWSEACSGSTTCTPTVNGATAVTATYRHRLRAFVSKAGHDGAFGSVANVDRFCASQAVDAGLPADGGNWRAFVTPGDVVARFAGNSGWVRAADGLPLANTASDLLEGRVFYPFNLDMDGNRGNTSVWVGSLDGGTNDCLGWQVNDSRTGAIGFTFTAGWGLVSVGGGACYNQNSVYCLEVGPLALVNKPLVIPPGGRRAFVSGALVSGTLSRAALDAVCQQEAVAMLPSPGSFAALLTTEVRSAASLFDLDGGTWYRVDGVKLLASAQVLGTPSPLLIAALNVQADGGQLLSDPYGVRVWTGRNPSTISSFDSCPAWDGQGTSSTGARGSAVTFGQTYWFEGGSSGQCSSESAHLYCFER